MVLYGHLWFCMALNGLTQLCTVFVLVFKLRLGAFIPRSVGWSVGLLVGLSVCPPKITKNL